MNIKNISISLLGIAIISLLVVLGSRVRVGATADSIAVLKTSGMTCSSCSGKITTALQSLKGVAVTEVDLDGGWVIVGYDTKLVKPESLAAKVNDTGFISSIQTVVTPEQFKQITGRDIGRKAAAGGCGCCGKNGGANKPS